LRGLVFQGTDYGVGKSLCGPKPGRSSLGGWWKKAGEGGGSPGRREGLRRKICKPCGGQLKQAIRDARVANPLRSGIRIVWGTGGGLPVVLGKEKDPGISVTGWGGV